MQPIRQASTAVITAFLVAFAAAPVTPAMAQDWERALPLQGDPAAQAAEHDALFAALAAAPDPQAAQVIAFNIWSLWFRAPTEEARQLMDDAMERRRAYDFAGSIAILDKLVALTPDWAEAWNQRATLRFLAEDFDGSLEDIDRVLALEPKHFGALSGQALILLRFGRIEAAQSVLRRAVAINPFLAERALLVETPEPNGKDI